MFLSKTLSDKYTILEILFFPTYYVVFSLLSSIEYNFLENRDFNLFWAGTPEQVFYGLKAILPAVIFYKIIIQRFLFKKLYFQFLIGIVVYLILLNAYNLYGYLLVSEISWFPDTMRNTALRWYNSDITLRFSIIYMFREFLVLTALAYFIRSARQETKIAQLHNQQMAAELNYLKTQIQPHFFFNTLNNIYALALQKSEKAAPLVAKHAEIMRYILSVENSSVLLKDEIEFLENFVEVESVRYSDKINIQFEHQGISSTHTIAPLLLLPFVENTFKHGVGEETGAGFVSIIISQIEDELSVEISNSKSINISAANRGGFGLSNVKKRLELLYPSQYNLLITDDKEVFTMVLTLNLQVND